MNFSTLKYLFFWLNPTCYSHQNKEKTNNFVIEDKEVEDIEFELMLHVAFNELDHSSSLKSIPSKMSMTNTTLTELRLLREMISQNFPTQKALSEHCISTLKKIFTTFPLLGHCICRFVSSPVSHFWTTSKQIQLMYIEVLNSIVLNKQRSDILESLPFADLVDQSDLQSHLSEIFSEIIKLTEQDNQFLHQLDVYSSILTSERSALIQFYCKLEDEHSYQVSQQPEKLDSPFPFELFEDKLSEYQFSSKFFNFLRTNNIHFVDFVINRSLYWIQQKEINKLIHFFKLFPRLKPLILLMAWENHKPVLTNFDNPNQFADLWQIDSSFITPEASESFVFTFQRKIVEKVMAFLISFISYLNCFFFLRINCIIF